MVEITATEQNIEQRMKRNEDSLRDIEKLKNKQSMNNSTITKIKIH